VEYEEVDIQLTVVQTVASRGQLCVVGKLFADQNMSKETIKDSVVRWWKPLESITFKVLGDNLFLIEFDDIWDKIKVLEGRPWVFKDSLFLVEDFTGRTSPLALTFKRASFWVRMINLPLVCMGREVDRKIGATVGVMEEVDTDADGVG
jgi:hypothetical protein